MHLLLVEDNPVNTEMLRKRLLRRGYTVTCANSAEDGIELVLETPFNVILMDIGLPGIDGLEATRRLKANSQTSAIPVIAVTAHALEADRTAALASGCDDFTTKPIIIESLIEKIERFR